MFGLNDRLNPLTQLVPPFSIAASSYLETAQKRDTGEPHFGMYLHLTILSSGVTSSFQLWKCNRAVTLWWTNLANHVNNAVNHTQPGCAMLPFTYYELPIHPNETPWNIHRSTIGHPVSLSNSWIPSQKQSLVGFSHVTSGKMVRPTMNQSHFCQK